MTKLVVVGLVSSRPSHPTRHHAVSQAEGLVYLRLLLHLLLHNHPRRSQAVDGQGWPVEAGHGEQVVLAVPLPPLARGAAQAALLPCLLLDRQDGGAEYGRQGFCAFGLDGGVDVERVDKLHEGVELALLGHHGASVEKVDECLDQGCAHLVFFNYDSEDLYGSYERKVFHLWKY